MTPRVRRVVAMLAGGLVGVFMLWGAFGLPAVGDYAGPYGDVVNAAAPVERQVQNVVTAINFDYRGVDTLGEEYILFAAVAAGSLLLRRIRTESEARGSADPTEHPGEALHAWGVGITATTLLFGLYIALPPGDQPRWRLPGRLCARLRLAGHVLVVAKLKLLHRVTPEQVVQFAEALGAAAYGAVGVAMLLAGGAFLQNMLPLGSLGSAVSGGSMQIINAGVALEVTAGFVLILLEFLRQTEELREGAG